MPLALSVDRTLKRHPELISMRLGRFELDTSQASFGANTQDECHTLSFVERKVTICSRAKMALRGKIEDIKIDLGCRNTVDRAFCHITQIQVEVW